ncbi:MAG TPA: FecR family protein [Puia sp.]|nr:FecR family protein [Puia sp.]
MDAAFNSMEDLAFSRSFRNWVLDPEGAERQFWEAWALRNPDKAEMVRQARALIGALERAPNAADDHEVDQEVKKALVRLRDAPRYLPMEGPDRRESRRLQNSLLGVTAMLFAGIAVAAFLFFRLHAHRNVLRSFLGASGTQCLQVTAGDELKAFRLPDGSLVRLGRNSTLYYPAGSPGGGNREVYLDGAAYFEVRKDPASPFYIYSSRLVTRLLGTSVIVRDMASGPRAVVTVLTGAVSVYRADDFYDHMPGSEPGLILTRNQEAIDDSRGDRLEKTIAAKPLLSPDRPDTGLVFTKVPAGQVFSRLEELYGIPIEFDPGAVDSCFFTARLDGRSFYQQLDMVCRAIGGSYTVTDGTVIVTVQSTARRQADP